MSTSLATRPAARALFGADLKTGTTFTGHKFTMQSDGTAVVHDVEVFRAGTFRDSMGEQHTWTADHLNQMVAHFNLLRDGGIFKDPPVRKDHSYSVERLMGFIQSLRTDGVKLYADHHVTEPEDLEKLRRGTFRSVSLEVGMYTTNDEASYWPVVFGVAYVDIPAVEGLHEKNLPVAYFSRTDTQETDVNFNKGTGTQVDDKGASPPAQSQHTQADPGTGANPPAPPAQPSTPPAPATPPSQPHTFTIAGRQTTDFAAVQAYVTALETAAKTAADQARKDFVSGLAKDKKILETEKDKLEKFALGLSEEQFTEWTATYATAPVQTVLQSHGGNGNPNPRGEVDPVADEIAVCESQVEMFRRARMKDEQIQKTPAYQRLQVLKNKS